MTARQQHKRQVQQFHKSLLKVEQEKAAAGLAACLPLIAAARSALPEAGAGPAVAEGAAAAAAAANGAGIRSPSGRMLRAGGSAEMGSEGQDYGSRSIQHRSDHAHSW